MYTLYKSSKTKQKQNRKHIVKYFQILNIELSMYSE